MILNREGPGYWWCMSYVIQYSKCRSKKDKEKSGVRQHLQNKIKNRALKWCLGLLLKKLLLPALLFCRCLFTLTSWLRVSASGSSDKMKRGDRGGAEGCFLKGSCDHSESRRRPRSQCQQTWGSKRRECVPMWHPPLEFFAQLWCSAACWVEKHWRRTVLRMRCCPRWGGVWSLFSRGQGPTLSVMPNALGAIWLPDVVIVWSCVLRRQRRVIAPWPGNKTEDKINQMR